MMRWFISVQVVFFFQKMKHILIIEGVFSVEKGWKKTAENKQTQRDGQRDCFEPSMDLDPLQNTLAVLGLEITQEAMVSYGELLVSLLDCGISPSWFVFERKGIPHENALDSGLGIIVICPHV